MQQSVNARTAQIYAFGNQPNVNEFACVLIPKCMHTTFLWRVFFLLPSISLLLWFWFSFIVCVNKFQSRDLHCSACRLRSSMYFPCFFFFHWMVSYFSRWWHKEEEKKNGKINQITSNQVTHTIGFRTQHMKITDTPSNIFSLHQYFGLKWNLSAPSHKFVQLDTFSFALIYLLNNLKAA